MWRVRTRLVVDYVSELGVRAVRCFRCLLRWRVLVALIKETGVFVRLRLRLRRRRRSLGGLSLGSREEA